MRIVALLCPTRRQGAILSLHLGAGDIGGQILVEVGRVHDHRDGALLGPGFLEIGPADDLDHLGIELVDDRLGVAAGAIRPSQIVAS